ncbi:MAG: hypothetical protein JHD00_09550 [Akkermansiaceae bacterium]|jgi:hypothetical protein|nr:hypothetical protein [Akkermansiaceae bacterium]MBJ7285336.1 hypothetical protein [Akkermansiaceae bacterium]
MPNFSPLRNNYKLLGETDKNNDLTRFLLAMPKTSNYSTEVGNAEAKQKTSGQLFRKGKPFAQRRVFKKLID